MVGSASLYPYSTPALEGGGWSAPRPGRFTPGKRGANRCTGGWVGPKVGLVGSEKSSPHRVSNPRPSSPYRVATPTTPSWYRNLVPVRVRGVEGRRTVSLKGRALALLEFQFLERPSRVYYYC